MEHNFQCPFSKTCDNLSFVYKYYLDCHLFEAHRVGLMPHESLRPKEEQGTEIGVEESFPEEEISLSDLEVTEKPGPSGFRKLSISPIQSNDTLEEKQMCYQCNLAFSSVEDLKKTHIRPLRTRTTEM